MLNFDNLTKRLNNLNINFDESSETDNNDNSLKNQKGKYINPLDIQVGDTIRFKNNEWVVTDYIDRIHGVDQRNRMQEPNTLVFGVFNCSTEDSSTIKIRIDDETVELLKNNNDVYHIEYVKPKILNNEKIIEKHDLVMQAETKKEVEERMEDKGAKVKVTRVEKLVHTKVNKEKKNKK